MGKAVEGSVSHATMRSEDLIPTFIAVLKDIDADQAAEYERDLPEDLGSEEACDFLDDLFDVLDGHAPEGCYFGAHPGDGSDYGFWRFEDEN